ncbi:MAG: single-stranded-DNA-specific exonuclease RecJ [Clostridia bacterium]|nr:single-stranded-DNA-specific exonuclease RecJ [Clostridia bacterium]
MFDSSRWNVLTQDEALVRSLSSALNIAPLCARLLINRSYTDEESARAFIEKSDVFFHSPYLMKDIKKAVSIIKDALEKEEKITIYGDYDVDGVTSVSILYMYLREHGGSVDYYIPTRDGEGYGLNTAAFDTIKKRGTKLVITVDTGITATQEIEYAKSIGLDVIVTDHHQCPPELPDANAVVNPKRPDCEYPFKELSGVGVVFKILCALELDYVNDGEYNLYTIKDMCRRYIDIVTIGTIADVMPLVGENRVIAHLGLGMLQNVRNIGVRALFRASGVIGGSNQKKITSSTISFNIAPKINAVGRIGSAERAVKLFLTDSPAQADIIAEELCCTNRDRQEMENVIYKEAFEKIESEYGTSRPNVIVLSSDKWHHGVIGIVASRITEKFGVPAVLISFEGATPDENGKIYGKGSVRSTQGINIVEALAACSDLLYKFGGHALAAGLSIEEKNIEPFKRHLDEYIGNAKEGLDVSNKTDVEAEITEDDVTLETAEALYLLEPYGAGNPVPLFVLRNAEITDIAALSGGKHTRMTLCVNSKNMNSVMFGSNLIDEGYMVGDRVDIVCSIDVNDFRNVKNAQLTIRDTDRSQSDKEKLSEEKKELASVINDLSSVKDADIPNRNDFVLIYNELKNYDGKTMNFRAFAGAFPYFSYARTFIALKALDESGIAGITEDASKAFMYKVHINKVSEKKDLTKTPIMTKLLER